MTTIAQPPTAPDLIRFDDLSADRAIELAVERLLRLRPGQTAELGTQNAQVVHGVRAWLHDFDPARFGLEYLTPGANGLLRVTCRNAVASAGIGYPG